jgi:RNA ligase
MNWNKEIQPYVDDGYVKKVKHPKHDLYLYTYTPKTSYDRHWDDITRLTRGLVVDGAGCVVGRGFDKMFNIHELPHEVRPPFQAREKVDGSLIHMFRYKDHLIIHSKGSFTSDVAIAAQQWAKGCDWSWIKADMTVVCEWISPDSRIVINYGEREELVLLGVRDMNSNEFLDIDTMNQPLMVAENFKEYHSLEELKDAIPDNYEGFVIQDSKGQLAKIKSAHYVELHRSIFHLTTDTVWELCQKSWQEYFELIRALDRDAQAWVHDQATSISEYRALLYQYLHGLYDNKPEIKDRKEFAEWARQYDSEVSPVLFQFYSSNGKDTEKSRALLWKLARPSKNRYRFQPKSDEEDL